MSLKLLRQVTGRGYGTTVVAAIRLNTPATINAQTVQDNTVYTVPVLTTICVLAVRLRCTEATNITDPAEASVWVTGADDIYPEQPLYGLTAIDKMWIFPEGGCGVLATAGQSIKLGIGVAASGDSQSIEADVIGYEVS